MQTCPCYSNKKYEDCCGPIHRGSPPKNAEALMRSRYSAYSLQLIEYIIKTTHSNLAPSKENLLKDRTRIMDFSKNTKFTDLKILGAGKENGLPFVTFRAGLERDGKDISYTEKSLFKVEDGILKYFSGSHI